MPRKEILTGRNSNHDRRAANEALEELSRSIGNSRVRDDAAISVGKLNIESLGTFTVGTSATTVRHTLGQTPSLVVITMTSAGQVWQTDRGSERAITVQADAGNRTCRIWVGA